MIYLDNNSTTKVDPLVFGKMEPYLKDSYGNPGSLYSLGRECSDAIKQARDQVAGFFNCDTEQVVFTSGGTEGNNMVLRGVVEHLVSQGISVSDKEILISSVEHDSIRHTASRLKDIFGISCKEIDVISDGEVKLSSLEEKISENTILVSVMAVNNETGTANQVKEIAKICHDHGVLFHTDCVQAASTHKIDVKEIDCDFATISGHKIHGPKGIGAVYIKDSDIISPLINGGNAQEFGLRGGTEPVHSIVGLGEACRILNSNFAGFATQVSDLKSVFYKTLEKHLSAMGLKDIMHVNGEPVNKPGKTLNLRFDRIDGQSLVLMLDSNGVCVSAGSACRSHAADPSHVLMAMGLSEEDARSSIRISFSRFNTQEEVYEAAGVLASCVAALITGV